MAVKAVSKAKWKQMRGKVKEQWGKLTDNDLDVVNGRIDQLVGKIQEKYAVKSGDIEKDVHDWWNKNFQKERVKPSVVSKVSAAPRGKPKESLFKKLQHL